MTALLLVLENDPSEAVGLIVPHAVEGAEARDKAVFIAVVLNMADLAMSRCAGLLILRKWESAEGVVEVICGRFVANALISVGHSWDLYIMYPWSGAGGIPECVDFQLLEHAAG